MDQATLALAQSRAAVTIGPPAPYDLSAIGHGVSPVRAPETQNRGPHRQFRDRTRPATSETDNRLDAESCG